jgi:hypothetical protein
LGCNPRFVAFRAIGAVHSGFLAFRRRPKHFSPDLRAGD